MNLCFIYLSIRRASFHHESTDTLWYTYRLVCDRIEDNNAKIEVLIVEINLSKIFGFFE